MGVKSNQRLLNLAVVLYILSGFAYAQFGQKYERILFMFFILVSVMGIRSFIIPKGIVLNSMDFSYTFFCLTFLIDFVLYQTVNPLVYGIAMFVMYFVVRFVMLQNFLEKFYEINYSLTLFFSIMVYVISFAMSGIYTHMYRGSMGNSNTMGIFAASACTVVIAEITYELVESRRPKCWLIMVYTISMFIVYVSGSRTAVLVVAVQIAIMLTARKDRHRIPLRTVRRIFAAMGILAVVFVIYLVIGKRGGVQNGFVDKFAVLAARGDISNGRFYRWEAAWRGSSWFGDGTMVFGEVVHNVYLGLVNTYGKLNGISFFAFTIIVLMRSVKFCYSSYKGRWKYLPIMSGVLFVLVSMTENYLMTYPMILMFISIPLICREDCIKKRRCSFLMNDS